jgi:hypothetical protein
MAHPRINWLAGLAAALLTLSTARAADADKLIPADSQVVVTINVKQILDAPIVKKRGVPHFKEALQSSEEVKQILDDLGFDPFTDLDRVTVAGPGGNEQDRGLVIVHGRFDLDKFKARAEKLAKDQPDAIKIRKAGGGVVYEVSIPGQDKEKETPLFIALLNKTTIVASPGKDYVVDAMKKEKGGSAEASGIKDKDFAAVVAKMDDKQSLSFAAAGAAFKGTDLGPASEFIGKIEALGGGLTVGDEIKLEVVLSAHSEEDAKKIKEAANTGINSGIALLGLVAGDHKELDKILDILKTVKATAKAKTVTLKVRVNADVLEELSGKDS